MASIRSSGITEFMYMVSHFFDFSVYSILVFLLVAILIKIVRGIRYSIIFLSSIFLTGVSVLLLKILFNVARPSDSVISAFGQSFPSYHATVSTVFFIMLMYVFDRFFKSSGRILFNSICTASILLISFSRIYLGVHWFSDVIAGILLSILISYFSIKISKKI